MGADLPGPLCLPSAFPFVGRESELAALRELLPTADDARRVAVLGGEAGSGKSRLVRELAAEAAERGALVLYGACDAVVRAPYGAFVEALEHLARVLEPAALRAALGPTGGELARLIPDLGDPAPRPETDPDTVRHRLHTAVTDLLTAVSRDRPVLLVLEDTHWADAPTLGLLRHLARASGRARLLLLVTFRDAEVPDGLSETLADLRRSDDVVRLRLPGLSGEDVGDFVRRAGAGADVAELARTISDLTAGNAFLVCELWRALVDTNVVRVVDGELRLVRPLAELGTPESVREVVGGRLARLRPETSDLLELAAVAGSEFGLDVLRAVAGPGEANVLGALDEAVRSGMIEELSSVRLEYRFAHELVRRALYDRLTGLRRAELHLRVGEALEASGARGAAELAHHFTAAAPLAGAARGIAYNVDAARHAAAALAFDEAAERLEVALGLGVVSPAERAELLIELGQARHRAGRAVEALAAFAAAADLADASELLARAAIGYEDACWRPVITDQLAVDLLERAAAGLGEEPSQLRVGVLGGLSRALLIRGEHLRGAAVREEAIAMARQLGDRAALATVLAASYWSRETNPPGRVLEALTEARDIAAELGDVELRTVSMNWRAGILMALGDIDSARDEVNAVREIAERAAQPFHLHVAEHCGSAIALCEGRLADAEAMAERSHEWSRLLTGRDASGVFGIQMFGVRREQGRLDELAPVLRLLAGEGGHWRPGLASLLAELGMESECRRELARVTREGLDQFRASLWLASLTYLSDACAAVGDEVTAEVLYRELAPLAGDNVLIGHVVACYGAADRYLGMLAAVLGDFARAEQHFEAALELNRRMGAQTWLAHTAYEYGRSLLVRGGDERAAALLGEAEALGSQIGMPALRRRIAALGAETHPATPSLPDGLSFREVQILSLVAEGLSNREIGTTLFISEHTAANHIRSILRKTRCANRTEAATYAHRHGLVEV
ncbi:AAA family ATPase [Solirubrobacter ginsenosidimutans]|uniref:AAA family ATPase n=1 Tax=Solirubrobacter ginsenosidimutans TaxID=490573 RepID=A0A9X3MZP0_9ACTN|nr:AAA family ATPase [Solirubrobacter ginsenosidimutans]MDA0165996.1 AAA family ATPase [Solirubrobacter ginsenosidimutans]